MLGQVTATLILVAGGLLTADSTVGYFWIAAAVICGYVVSILNAWVLLIEILR